MRGDHEQIRSRRLPRASQAAGVYAVSLGWHRPEIRRRCPSAARPTVPVVRERSAGLIIARRPLRGASARDGAPAVWPGVGSEATSSGARCIPVHEPGPASRGRRSAPHRRLMVEACPGSCCARAPHCFPLPDLHRGVARLLGEGRHELGGRRSAVGGWRPTWVECRWVQSTTSDGATAREARRLEFSLEEAPTTTRHPRGHRRARSPRTMQRCRQDRAPLRLYRRASPWIDKQRVCRVRIGAKGCGRSHAKGCALGPLRGGSAAGKKPMKAAASQGSALMRVNPERPPNPPLEIRQSAARTSAALVAGTNVPTKNKHKIQRPDRARTRDNGRQGFSAPRPCWRRPRRKRGKTRRVGSATLPPPRSRFSTWPPVSGVSRSATSCVASAGPAPSIRCGSRSPCRKTCSNANRRPCRRGTLRGLGHPGQQPAPFGRLEGAVGARVDSALLCSFCFAVLAELRAARSQPALHVGPLEAVPDGISVKR